VREAKSDSGDVNDKVWDHSLSGTSSDDEEMDLVPVKSVSGEAKDMDPDQF